MVANFIIIIIFTVILYYALSNENSQFAATASAIRQIWSGTCRLSCRQSQYSGLSGLSGLPEHATPDECVCDTCPCAHIDNFLRSCRPATQMYENATNTAWYWFSSFLKSISEICEYLSRVFECSRSCRRQAQMTSTNDNNSSEKFSFDRDRADEQNINMTPKPIEPNSDISKTVSRKKSSITFKEPLKINDTKEVGTATEEHIKATNNVKSKVSEETLKPASSSASQKAYCKKCIEKGETCGSDCPRAKKKK